MNLNLIARAFPLFLCGLLGVSVINPATPIIHHRDTEIAQRRGEKRPLIRRFDFGPGPLAAGYERVMPQNIYSREAGFGFERGPQIACINRGGKDPLRSDLCTSDQPFYFSVALPEGNYNVSVTFGDAQAESVTTVKAELRRLTLESVETKPGKYETRTFTVN